MDIGLIKIGDTVKYVRNETHRFLKVSEIGSSYGLDKIFYNDKGGFCMGKEVISIIPSVIANKLYGCMYCGLKNNTPYWCDECGDLR